MKRKRPAAPVTAAAAVEQSVAPEAVKASGLSTLDVGKIVGFSLLLFLAMTVQTGRMVLLLAAAALLASLPIGKEPLRNLRQHLSLPVLGLLAFALMNGLAAVYSSFGGYAVSEFYKIVASFSLAVILLVRFDRRHVRGLLWGIAAVCAVIALISVDAACQGGLFRLFERVAGMLGSDFSNVVEEGYVSRVNGIYSDANITAGILALGTLDALYLTCGQTQRKWRLLSCILLGVCAQGFFLSMSRGAILCLALAFLVWLIAAKGARIELFLLMLVSAAVTAALSVVIMPRLGAGEVFPVVLVLVSGIILFLVDWAVVRSVSRLLEGHQKAAVGVLAVLVVACVGYAVAAVTVTGAYTFNSTGHLRRTVSLEPGTYTVSGAWDGDISVWITAPTLAEELKGDGEVLYSGPLEDAVFTVPEGAAQAVLGINAEPGTVLERLEFSNGKTVPLNYPLAPAFLMNRFQGGLLTDNSFLVRVQYMKDALTLFARSPLTGHGLGSTEGLYTSVQPFYYESKYVHNHILQVMDDMGLLGLAGFLTLLLGSAWLLLKNLRSETGGLAAMLLACWVMMNAHGLMELNFSIRAYQCMAFLFLLFPALLYAKPLSAKVVKWGGLAAAGFIWLYLLVFGALLEGHRMVSREAAEFSTDSASVFMDTLESYVRRDVFDHEQHQLTYVANAALLKDGKYNGNMRRYVQELRASGTYTACSGLARYYYLPRGEFAELFACSREGISQEASTSDAWNLQLKFYRNEVLPAAGAEHVDEFMDGVLALRDYLAEYSQGRMEEIQLTEENQAFLDAASSAQEAGLSGDVLYLCLTQVLGYGQADTGASGE